MSVVELCSNPVQYAHDPRVAGSTVVDLTRVVEPSSLLSTVCPVRHLNQITEQYEQRATPPVFYSSIAGEAPYYTCSIFEHCGCFFTEISVFMPPCYSCTQLLVAAAPNLFDRQSSRLKH